MNIRLLLQDCRKSGFIALLVMVGTAVCSLFASVVWVNLTSPLDSFRSGDNVLVGETVIAGSKASNGIADGVLADLAARSNTASFVGGLYQRRSEVGDQHRFTDEVVTFVSPGLTQEIRLAAGSVPRTDLNWVLVSDSSLALGSGVVIDGRLRIVSGILPHSFTFPRMRPSKYVVPFVPNAQSRGGGTGFLVAQSGTPDLLRTELLHLMELIRSEHEEDSQTFLQLQSAAEFSRSYSQSALALGAMLLGMIVVALVVYLGLLVGLQFNRIQPRWRVMLMLGADVRNLTAQFVGPLCLVALAGSIVGLPLAQAGVWWLREQSPWMIEWPSTAQLAVATLVSMIAFQLVVLALGLSMRAGIGSQRSNWTGPIASFSLVAGAVWLAFCLIPLDRKIEQFLESPTGFSRSNLFLVSVVESGSRQADWQYFQSRLQQDLRIGCVAVSDQLPLTSMHFPYNLLPASTPSHGGPEVLGRHVSASYRACLEIPLLAGNDALIVEGQETTPVLLSETAARRLFPGRPAVGELLKSQYQSRGLLKVAGVIADSRQLGLVSRVEGQVLLSLRFSRPGALLLRTKSPLAERDVEQLLRIEAEAANVPFRFLVGTVESLQRRELSRELFHQGLLRLLSAALLLIAMIGVGAAMASQIASGRKETAIRIALGASHGRVLGSIVSRFAFPVLGGVACGIWIAAESEPMLAAYIPNLRFDWAAEHLLPLGLVALAVLASLLPAYIRTLRLDPARLLNSAETPDG